MLSVLLTVVFAGTLFVSGTWHIGAEFADTPPTGRVWYLGVGLLAYAAGAYAFSFVSQTGEWGAKLLVTTLFVVVCVALIESPRRFGHKPMELAARLPRAVRGGWGVALFLLVTALLLATGVKALLPIVLIAIIPALNLPLAATSTWSTTPSRSTGSAEAALPIEASDVAGGATSHRTDAISPATQLGDPLGRIVPALLAAAATLLMGLATLSVSNGTLLTPDGRPKTRSKSGTSACVKHIPTMPF